MVCIRRVRRRGTNKPIRSGCDKSRVINNIRNDNGRWEGYFQMGIKSTAQTTRSGKMKLFSWLAYQFDYAAPPAKQWILLGGSFWDLFGQVSCAARGIIVGGVAKLVWWKDIVPFRWFVRSCFLFIFPSSFLPLFGKFSWDSEWPGGVPCLIMFSRVSILLLIM